MWSVFILYENALFARGLERLLQHEGLNVVGVGRKNETPLEQIKAQDPDVILAEAKMGDCGPEPTLCCFLIEEKPCRVVRLSLEDNTASLYTCYRWRADTVEDLVKGIVGSISGTKRVGKMIHV